MICSQKLMFGLRINQQSNVPHPAWWASGRCCRRFHLRRWWRWGWWWRRWFSPWLWCWTVLQGSRLCAALPWCWSGTGWPRRLWRMSLWSKSTEEEEEDTKSDKLLIIWQTIKVRKKICKDSLQVTHIEKPIGWTPYFLLLPEKNYWNLNNQHKQAQRSKRNVL